MTGAILALVLAYVAVAALLLNLNLATSVSPWVKGAAIVLVTGLYAGAWYGYRGLLGWASPDPLPDAFRVLWITVDEPDKAADAGGSIFFWVRELDAAGLPAGEPRAYRIPWDEESAEAAQDALERVDDGELVNGRMSRAVVAEREVLPESAGGHVGERSVTGAGAVRPNLEFTRVPPPALPPKAAPAEAP